MSKWNNVPVSFTVELGRREDWTWEDLTFDKSLPVKVLVELDMLAPVSCEGLELDFDVRSSGSYNPYHSHPHDPDNDCAIWKNCIKTRSRPLRYA